MISGRHEHRCGICNRRFECMQITHCKKVSSDPDPLTRPVCYKDECRIAQDEVIKALCQRGEADTSGPDSSAEDMAFDREGRRLYPKD